MDHTWTVQPGSDEAMEIAETIQQNEVATEIDGGGASMQVTDAEANEAVAGIHYGMMELVAMARSDVWRCGDEEYATVRDEVAPEVRDQIPDHILLKINRGGAFAQYAQIIFSKAAADYRAE